MAERSRSCFWGSEVSYGGQKRKPAVGAAGGEKYFHIQQTTQVSTINEEIAMLC